MLCADTGSRMSAAIAVRKEDDIWLTDAFHCQGPGYAKALDQPGALEHF